MATSKAPSKTKKKAPAKKAEIVAESPTDSSEAPKTSHQAEIMDDNIVQAPSKLPALGDGLSSYLAAVSKYPLLTREQEQEIAKRYKEKGDPKDAEILVTSNLRFVVKVAADYSQFGNKLIDLIQEGNVGLMHAVREFNPYKGVRLITYAVWWIKGYINEYLMRQHSIVRIGTTHNQRKLFYNLQKEKNRLDQMGEEPTIKLLSDNLGVPEKDVAMMEKRLSRGGDLSLDKPLGNDESSSLLDFEAIDEAPVDQQIIEQESLQILDSALGNLRENLNEKELYILENRLLNDPPMKLQEIGTEWGVTREAVRQMEGRLLKKIKKEVLSKTDS